METDLGSLPGYKSKMTEDCLLQCSVGIKDLIQSTPNNPIEPLEERLEKDVVKKMIREKMEKNYNLKPVPDRPPDTVCFYCSEIETF